MRRERRESMPIPYKRAAYILATLFLAINVFLESVGLTPEWVVRCVQIVRSVGLSVSEVKTSPALQQPGVLK